MDAEADNETPTKCRKKSASWKYFEPPNTNEGTAMCKLCSEHLSYRSSVSNLKKHLVRKHKLILNEEMDYGDSGSEAKDVVEKYPRSSIKEVLEKYPRSSNVWVHYEAPDREGCTAKCKHCYVTLSYLSGISNLKHHLTRKHNIDYKDNYEDDEVIMSETYLEDEDEGSEIDEEQKDKRRILRSGIWEYFDVTDEDQKTANCRLCNEDFSYKTTSSNLKKHLQRRHSSVIEQIDSDNDDERSSLKSEEQLVNKRTAESHRPSKAWDYFTIKDPTSQVATCNLCDKDCSYRSISNLLKHVRRLHGTGYFNTENDGENQATTLKFARPRSIHPQRSTIWAYFKHTDRRAGLAMCLICKKNLKYLSSLTNLKRHLIRKHPRLQFDGILDTKKTILGSDGQLYEIDVTTKEEVINESDDNNEDQQQAAETMEIYLDEIEGNIVEKRITPNSPTKKIKQVIVDSTSDSDDDVTYKTQIEKTSNDTLEKFASYLVSLLRQLPKSDSNRLQADFIRQIMNCQNNDRVASVNNVTTLPNNEDLVAVSSASNDDIFVETGTANVE